MARSNHSSTISEPLDIAVPGLYPRAYEQSGLLAWLERPREGHGLRFAMDDGSWELWEYPRLAATVAAAAEQITEQRCRPRGVVSIATRTGPEFVAAFFGALVAGNVPSPLAFPLSMRDPRQYVQHVAAVLEAADPALVLADPAVHELLGDAATCAKLSHQPQEFVMREGTLPPQAAHRDELALLQFTSGSSGRPRGVRVTWENIETNVAMIRHWLRIGANDEVATWLPLYHDMGLIGALLMPVVNQTDVWIMRPDQFVREPMRWLGCFGSNGVEIGVAPNFGFAYAMKHIEHEAIGAMDFSRWRTAIVAAERLDPAVLGQFAACLAPQGFKASAFMPAYGLAEATLAVTGVELRRTPRTVSVDWSTVRMAEPVTVTDETSLVDTQRIGRGDGWLVGCGEPHPSLTVSILDDDGEELPDHAVGEIAVEGPTVADEYQGGESGSTRFVGDRLCTGDAGFIDGGELFVLGRLGDSIKVRGRTVFAEDLESRLTTVEGVHKGKCVVLAGTNAGSDFLVALVEAEPGEWVDGVVTLLHSEGGANTVINVLAAGRGVIERTSSGKPRRRVLWQAFLDGLFVAETVYDSAGAQRDSASV